MLTNIENRLEELFEQIEMMPPEKVEMAEKVRIFVLYCKPQQFICNRLLHNFRQKKRNDAWDCEKKNLRLKDCIKKKELKKR